MTQEWHIRDSRDPHKVFHPTTQAVLTLFPYLRKTHDFGQILDMGCGSGLLSIAAADIWPQSKILAADISEQAILDATHNVAVNAVERQIEVVRSEGYSHPMIAKNGPYNLIVSNLIAELHLRYAREVKEHLAPNGVAILAGLLAWLTPPVIELYEQMGFGLEQTVEANEWRILVMSAKSPQSAV